MENRLEFTGNTYNGALKEACAHFECEPWMLEVVQTGEEDDKVTISAEYISIDKLLEYDRENPGTPAPALNVRDRRISDRFSASYREDGVYLVLNDERYPPKEIVEEFLALKKIKELSNKKLFEDIAASKPEILVANPQEEQFVDQSVKVVRTPDDMEATIEYFPGEPGGEALTLAEMTKKIQEAGVVKGIDISTLYKIYYGKVFNETFVIARGRPVKNGEDAVLTYNFSKNKERRPKILDDETVDYKNLDFIENVRKDGVLLTIKPETLGLDGYTVSGLIIKGKDGKRPPVPKGKNTELSSDKLQLLAACDGSVDIVDGKITVSNTLEIRGDVDASTGNIDFVGDIVINGNIKSGYTVKATGNIDVHKTVEAATVIADGNINLRQGVFGMNSGIVQAGGNIISLFIQNTRVSAKGSIMTDTILHSNVSSGDTIVVKGKKGLITGGKTTAALAIAAERSASSNSSTITILEVGIPPELRSRMQEIEKTISGHETNLMRLEPMGEKFRQLEMMGRLSTEQTIQKVRTMSMVSRIKSEIESMTAEREEIKELIKSSNQGSIHIRDSAYAFTTVIIGTAKLMLKDEYKFTTFKVVGGEIVALPYSYSGDGAGTK